MIRVLTLGAILVALAATTACSSIGRAFAPLRQAGAAAFTDERMGDLRMEGVTSGPCAPIRAEVVTPTANAEELEALVELLSDRAVGCLLPVLSQGESRPWWVFCSAGEPMSLCLTIPRNTRVRFAGQPLGVTGSVWIPTRLLAVE